MSTPNNIELPKCAFRLLVATVNPTFVANENATVLACCFVRPRAAVVMKSPRTERGTDVRMGDQDVAEALSRSGRFAVRAGAAVRDRSHDDLALGQDGLAGLKCQTRVGMTQIVQTDVSQVGLVAQLPPEPVQALCRSGSGPSRKDPDSVSGQAVQDRAGGGGQPDGSRSRLAVPQEQVAVAEVLPLKGHDLALAAAGQQQQFHGRCHGMAVMPFQHRAQSSGFLPGQEPFAAVPPVAPDVSARIASLRTEAESFGLPHDHRQDRCRPVGGSRRRSEGGEPLLNVCARDRADRPSPEPGKNLVPQVPAIDVERAGLPVPGLSAKNGVCNVLERRLCVDLRRAGRPARPARGQMRSCKNPRIGKRHRACIADFRPDALPVDLSVHEKPLAAGWQDPDAEAAEFRVADLADGLAGLEGFDQSLGQAAAGHGFSPESVALTDRNEAKRLHSGV